jgi:hypothetical protein
MASQMLTVSLSKHGEDQLMLYDFLKDGAEQ